MNTALFSASEFSIVTGGSWLKDSLPEKALAISTDTRNDNQGKIFFALSGEHFDAHNFLQQAADSGCEALCIKKNRRNDIDLPDNLPVLMVDDPLIAMQMCAAYHRNRFKDLTVFAVTGSVGKTSVKEMLRAICAKAAGEDAVLYTIGNTNNQIGVAQNLLRLTPEHRFAVLEAGTSSPGEILPLARIINPTGAIVNSIAPCHLENLIDLDGVAREKGDIFSPLAANAPAVFPENAAGKTLLTKAAENCRIITFGNDGKGDISSKFISGTLEQSSFELTFADGRIFTITWSLTGKHNAINAAGAAALANACGIAPEIICDALPDTRLPGMRMKKSCVDNITYYNDAYNANPASLSASIELLGQSTFPGRLILLLGGMRELGASSVEEHRKLLQNIRTTLPDAIVITIGQEFSGLSGCHFDSPEKAGEYLKEILQSNDTVFAKGSRGNAVEKALPPEAR